MAIVNDPASLGLMDRATLLKVRNFLSDEKRSFASFHRAIFLEAVYLKNYRKFLILVRSIFRYCQTAILGRRIQVKIFDFEKDETVSVAQPTHSYPFVY